MAIGRIPEPGTGIPESIVDAKGDIITATGSDAPARLAVGANGTTLVADSAEATGLKWATPAGGGKVLQVVYGTYDVDTTIASLTFTDTGLSLAITPTSATSKVLILATQSSYVEAATAVTTACALRLLRSGTTIYTQGDSSQSFGVRAIESLNNIPIVYLDSPNTTSATTYKIQARMNSTADSRSSTHNVGLSTITLLEIGA
jgi:hypothetical protein